MIAITSFDIAGYQIVEYKGIVRGVMVRSPTIMQGFFSSLKSIIGGKIGSLTAMCETARQQAYDLMVEHAYELGANAIIGVRYDASDIASRFSATEVICYGTAVVIQKNQPLR